AELAEASSVQADGLNEVNQAVADLDLSTQQNAAMAEQSSAASNQLNGEVQNLNQKAAIFIKHKEMSEASAHSDTGGHPPELRMAS
ncbi:MAG: chemotaxis protein, partial [Pseudomonadota bacterium]